LCTWIYMYYNLSRKNAKPRSNVSDQIKMWAKALNRMSELWRHRKVLRYSLQLNGLPLISSVAPILASTSSSIAPDSKADIWIIPIKCFILLSMNPLGVQIIFNFTAICYINLICWWLFEIYSCVAGNIKVS
jgi:hypothetical protein